MVMNPVNPSDGKATDPGAAETTAFGLRLATFTFDITPPLGHSCCGGWIKPVEAVDDGLEGNGIVLLGAGPPIVLCALDWLGLANEAHVAWRTALARAAGTTPDRVAVQCVHQHNAPFACLETERLVAAQGDLPHVIDVEFFQRSLDRAATTVAQSMSRARPVSHLGHGQACIERVASNRRVYRDATGQVLAMRGSACRDPILTALPEGLIDPSCKTVVFFNGTERLAALHYYATHPMSYYADGRVTSDFAGLARKQRQRDEPGCRHVYFTGCAGNISAGKYNDGSKATRPILTQRVYDGLAASETHLELTAVKSLVWKTTDLLLPPRWPARAADLPHIIANRTDTVLNRNRSAYELAWLHRVERQIPFTLSSLHLGRVKLLHLPAEPFIEYQLRAQRLQPDDFVCTAGYGDSGPWYLPVKEEYPHGGYEVSVALGAPEVDDLLTAGISQVLSA